MSQATTETKPSTQTRALAQRPQNGEVVTFKQRVGGLKKLLDQMRPQLAVALPRHIKAERIARVVLTTVQKTPQLAECTRESLVLCVLAAAQLGLEPDGLLGHAYLVPFKNTKKGGRLECQLIPGYKGLLKLARNSGEIASIEAAVVRVGDDFKFARGTDSFLKHRAAEPPMVELPDPRVGDGKATALQPDPNWRPGIITHAYAVAKLKDGTKQFEVMAVWEINQIRDDSQGYQSAVRYKKDSPWISHYPEMAKKTVLRRLCKMLPASIELQKAVAADEAHDAGLGDSLADAIDVSPEVEQVLETAAEEDRPASKLDALADRVSAEPGDDDHEDAAANEDGPM